MEKQGLNELAAAVHENAVAHGWWEQERELPEILMLCVSELAEALEEYRAGKPNIYYNVEGEEILYADGEACEKYERRKPEGVAVELADCVIRILDYCGRAGIDIEEAIRIKHEYNKTRPYRHGGRNVDRGSGAAGIALCKRSVRVGCAGIQEPLPRTGIRGLFCAGGRRRKRRRGLRCDNLSRRRITARCGGIRRNPP